MSEIEGREHYVPNHTKRVKSENIREKYGFSPCKLCEDGSCLELSISRQKLASEVRISQTSL